MAHSLIIGMTESGKTTLAKKLAGHYRQNGIGVLVLDPLSDPAWPADFKTADNEQFLKVYWDSRRCAVFIDESGDAIGRYDDTMIKTATRGRHWGHSNHYITQRATQLSATVRGQCSHLFLFCSPLSDAKIYADEWNQQELRNSCNLKQGEYYHVTRFGELHRGNIFEELNQ